MMPRILLLLASSIALGGISCNQSQAPAPPVTTERGTSAQAGDSGGRSGGTPWEGTASSSDEQAPDATFQGPAAPPSPAPASAPGSPASPPATSPSPPPGAPSGCSGNSTDGSEDLVLYSGETLTSPGQNVLALTGDWRADEAWGNGRLQVEAVGAEHGIAFSNEGIYHGFKFTPATVNGARKNFVLSGAEVYVQLQRSNPGAELPTFGLRVIKPGEFEGNGGAPTTTWMADKPVGGTRFLKAQSECALITMVMPQGFLDQNAVANRLIWEMQSSWSPADKLVIRKLVLKGFRFVP